MDLRSITINGARHRVESIDGGLVAGDFTPLGQTLPDLVNRLRFEGNEVITDPEDDGLTEVWYLCASSPRNRGSESVWHFPSQADAIAQESVLSKRHNHLDRWRSESHRVTPAQLRIILNRLPHAFSRGPD
jgi:hypothetical protein